jgi:type IV pilus assembly protein PilC
MAETYAYKVRDQAGKIVNGTLVADNQQLVLNRLREMNYVPINIVLQKKGMNRDLSFLTKKSPKTKDLAIFSRQFSTMVNSGLPIMKSLHILEQQTESKLLAETVGHIRIDIERGASLSSAMAKYPKVFNNLYVAMVKSGEAGGVLEAVMERLATNLEREVALRQKIKSAMTYPVVVLGFVTMILLAMLLFIVPQFKSIYSSLHGTLPLPTRILLLVSTILTHFFLEFVVVTVVGVVLLRRYLKTKNGREQWDKLKLKLPVFGPLVQKTALARFSRVLGVLNKSGVPILQSLEVVSETVNNSLMAKAILDVQESVKQGESLAKPLARHEVFPPMVVQMLAVGEETGALDTMLEKVAIFYDEEVSATVDSLTSLIEPLMIFVVGGAVGLAVIALYLPMFNVIKLIK